MIVVHKGMGMGMHMPAVHASGRRPVRSEMSGRTGWDEKDCACDWMWVAQGRCPGGHMQIHARVQPVGGRALVAANVSDMTRCSLVWASRCGDDLAWGKYPTARRGGEK